MKVRYLLVERRVVIKPGNDGLGFDVVAKHVDVRRSAPTKKRPEFHRIRRDFACPSPRFEDVKALARRTLDDQRGAAWRRDRLDPDVEMRS